MSQVSAEYLFQLLTQQEQQHVFVCQELLDELSTVLIHGKHWVCCYDQKTKHKPSQWEKPILSTFKRGKADWT
jgi:hypothetical protein